MNSNYTIGIHLEATGAARASAQIRQFRADVASLDGGIKQSSGGLYKWAQAFGPVLQSAAAFTQLAGSALAVAQAIGQASGALLSASAAAQRLHTQLNNARAAHGHCAR